MSVRTILVTGASSPIGQYLLPLLAAKGFKVLAVSRRIEPSRTQVEWRQADLSCGYQNPIEDTIDCVIHLAPIWLIAPVFELVPDTPRIIAFSSTSRFTKTTSSSAAELEVVEDLVRGERELSRLSESCTANWTLFRPTLIYGTGTDSNVGFIAKIVRRFPFFPVVGGGRGLRQPVHAEDLAKACVQALNVPATYNKAYNLSGGETFSYKAMVKRIAAASDTNTICVNVPAPLLKLLLRIASLRWKGLNSAMVERMNEDLCFDNTQATRDFGYAPRGFRPDARAVGKA